MTPSTDQSTRHMLAMTRASLLSLRSALLRDGGPQAATCLQEAGYAGGDALFETFQRWLSVHTDIAAEDLDIGAFEHRVSEFFNESGWGRIEIGNIDDVVATLDSADWGESEGSARMDHPACHITTGMFADLFGRLAGAPVAVLEVECRSAGHPRCRFLVGNPDVMDAVFEEMGHGATYEAAVKSAA
jgi:uncharacterized protein